MPPTASFSLTCSALSPMRLRGAGNHPQAFSHAGLIHAALVPNRCDVASLKRPSGQVTAWLRATFPLLPYWRLTLDVLCD
jgi:hypothetical protein